MSVTKKLLVDQVFSYDHLRKSTNKFSELNTDVGSVTLQIASSSKPTTRLPNNSIKRGYITCHDYQSIEYIRKNIYSSPKNALTVLLGGFDQAIDIIFITIDTQNYITRSAIINMSWCKRLWSLSSRAHIIAVTGIYYSVLGGAYCSLGKSNTKYAYKAGALAIEQIKLAKRLKDPILECKCWLYFAEDLIQLGKLKKARKIISSQVSFVESLKDFTMTSMLESVIAKMEIAIISQKKLMEK